MALLLLLVLLSLLLLLLFYLSLFPQGPASVITPFHLLRLTAAHSFALLCRSLCVVNSFCGTFVSLPWLFCLRFRRVLCPSSSSLCSSSSRSLVLGAGMGLGLGASVSVWQAAALLLCLHYTVDTMCLLRRPLLELVHPVHTRSLTATFTSRRLLLLSPESDSLAKPKSTLSAALPRWCKWRSFTSESAFGLSF